MTTSTSVPDPKRWWALFLLCSALNSGFAAAFVGAGAIAFGAALLAALAIRAPERSRQRAVIAVMLVIGLLAACRKANSEGHTDHDRTAVPVTAHDGHGVIPTARTVPASDASPGPDAPVEVEPSKPEPVSSGAKSKPRKPTKAAHPVPSVPAPEHAGHAHEGHGSGELGRNQP